MTATKTLTPQGVIAILKQAGHREAHPMGSVAGGGYLPGCDTSYEYVNPWPAKKTGRVIVIHRSDAGYDAIYAALAAYGATLNAAGLAVTPGNGCLYVGVSAV